MRRRAASSRPPASTRLPPTMAIVVVPSAPVEGRRTSPVAATFGSAVMVASAVDEEPLGLDDVMRILDATSQLRAHSLALEAKSRSLEQATAELRSANLQLLSLDGLKDDFMSSVTHELRTPLTSIRALSELMVDDPEMDSAQRQQFLNIVVAETERLSRLVNQVLDMAKIESGQAEWRSTEIDMPDLLQRAVRTTAELFRERGTLVSLHLPQAAHPPLASPAQPAKRAQPALPVPPVPPVLLGDEDRLLQVLLNLLSNAAKFVPQQGGQVALSLQADATGLTVTVQDNGPGVPADQQALIFEKFRQGGDASHRPQGTGLGLPISRQIIEHHGGRMWLRTDPEQGAAFCFTLPWQGSATPLADSPSALSESAPRVTP